MSGPIPSISTSILRSLANQVSQGTFTQASLEAAAGKMKVGLGQLMRALHAAQGEIGAQLSTGATRQTAASLARQVYSASQGLGSAAQLATLEAEAAAAAATAAETAGAGASAVGMGACALGLFGRVGSLVGLTGTAATVAGALAVGALVGGLVIGGARLAGSMSGDSATAQYGDAANATRGARPDAVDPGKGDDEPYAVFLMTNVSGGSIWVGQESSLKASLTCNFNGGGHCANNGGADIPVTYQKMSSDHFTFETAVTDYCASLDSEPVNWNLQFGTKAKVYGGDYWIDTAPGCP